MSYFLDFIAIYQVPLIIMLAGFFVHWLPDKIKNIYEKAFTAMPMWLQVISVAMIIVLMYQAIGAEQPPFVYLQF